MRRCALLVTACFLAIAPAFAQDRVALVIGNDRYANLPDDRQLKKAVNDARAVGGALEKLGFRVIRGENLNRTQMVDQLFKFSQAIKPGDTAILFFAGHGVSFSGGNYLLPTDIPLPKQGEETRARNLSLGEADIIADIQERKPRVLVMMLDACRDNPFKQPGLTRSIGNEAGLARGREAEGVFSIYSAGFGQTALDTLGAGDKSPNSVFTRALVPALARTDTHLADLVIDMREEVARLAATIGHPQYPAYYDQTRGGRLYLAGRPAPAIPAPQAPAPAPQAAPAAPPPPPVVAVPAPPPAAAAQPPVPSPQKPQAIAALQPASAMPSASSLRESWQRKVDSVVFAAAMTRDGRLIAIGKYDVQIVNADDGKTLRTLSAHKNVVRGLAFSPDGKLLASAGDEKDLKIWDTATGRLLRTLQSDSAVYDAVVFSPDGLRIAASGRDKRVHIWEVSGRLLHTFVADQYRVRALAFSPDGRLIASGGGSINLWDSKSGARVRAFDHRPGIFNAVAFSSDGRRLISGGANPQGPIEIWDVGSGQSLRTLSGPVIEAETLAVSPDGSRIVSAGGSDKQVRLWDVETGRVLQTIGGHTDRIRGISYSADGRRVMWGDWDGLVRVFIPQ